MPDSQKNKIQDILQMKGKAVKPFYQKCSVEINRTWYCWNLLHKMQELSILFRSTKKQKNLNQGILFEKVQDEIYGETLEQFFVLFLHP